MAVTNEAVVTALMGAALALPGLVPKASFASGPVLSPEAEFNYGHYNENGDRIEVDIYQIAAKSNIGSQFEITFSGVKDVISGASPVYNQPEILYSAEPANVTMQEPEKVDLQEAPKTMSNSIVSGASAMLQPVIPATPTASTNPADDNYPEETESSVPDYQFGSVNQVFTPVNFDDERHAFDIGLNYYQNDFMLGFSGGHSKEKDYLSNYGSLTLQTEFNDNLSTLTFGFSFSDDTIEPVTRIFDRETKTSQQYLLSLSQVVSKSILWQGNASYNVHQGYLSDPYKKALVADYGLVNDQRPEERLEWAYLNRFIFYIAPVDAALHVDYRYSYNDWRIDSHTFELSWYQPLSDGWQLAMHGRYYTQSDAYFYQPFFKTNRKDGFYTSDYRMAEFGALSGGIRLSKRFESHFKIDAGIEYYRRQSDWAFSGSDENSFADYSYTMATFTLSYAF